MVGLMIGSVLFISAYISFTFFLSWRRLCVHSQHQSHHMRRYRSLLILSFLPSSQVVASHPEFKNPVKNRAKVKDSRAAQQHLPLESSPQQKPCKELG
ncbi:hypothetical protein C8J57DRAFT_1303140 [Mycena rebaudengoi]|nr:hypothetical protein C8J57DRAFT_1303140 [Mycena rebaudengoi]